jgi:SAM-dependent methyltransferase
MVCDGRFLPFGSESFDAVIIQAVLEYLLTPAECVEEIHRVLKPGAIVYSEMPFLQGVHGGKYDFTRLTLLGHRRLYKCFSEIQSGACAGPATSLAWSIQQLFLSLATSATIRDCIRLGTSMGFFWLKYLDYLLLRAPGALDAATGTYLLARKSAISLSDHELLLQYRGAVPSTGIV